MNRVPPTRRLSYSPFFYKKVFPVLWTGAIVFFIGAVFLDGDPSTGIQALTFVGVIGLLGLAFVVILTSDLADEVLDGGDYLRVRRGKRSFDLPIIEIERVHEPLLQHSPPRIELVLRRPGPLGRVITFYPIDFSWIPFADGAVTKELRERITRARLENDGTSPSTTA